MVSLTIDGRNVRVPEGTTILEAAAELGIRIPTLCWLQKVSPTGACRVCLVDIEGLDRPQTACNTPVKEGISVITTTPALEAARKKMVELLLVNHPLDCPVCDAAGECDLQDSCYAFQIDRQEYAALPERKAIRYDWPLLESDPNRCILCEKCVKVDHEIVRADAIEVTCRGEDTIIDTVDGKPLNCEFCGNCAQACPVGALIHKPFKFRGRPWTFAVTSSVCAFCAAGCEVDYHVRNRRVERVTSDDAGFNSGNLCINGRYGYGYLNSSYRLTVPLLREGAAQSPTDWTTAVSIVAGRLGSIIAANGPDAVAGIGSPRVTNEENSLFGRLFTEAIGSGNIDSEAALGYATAYGTLAESLGGGALSATIDRIDHAGAVLVFGCDLNAESTGVEYRVIRAATKHDARLVLANMREVKLNSLAHSHLQYAPGTEVQLANALAKAILEEGLEDKAAIAAAGGETALAAALGQVSLEAAASEAGISVEDLRQAARHLGGRKSVAILFGNDVIRGGNTAAAVRALANLAVVCGAVGKDAGGVFAVTEKTNMRGMLEAGVSPATVGGKKGKDLFRIVEGIEQGTIKALYVVGCDPVTSFPEGGRIRKALEKLELLVVQDILPTTTSRLADVVLPAAASAEKGGSFTTLDGRVQRLQKAVLPPGEAKADLEIFTLLYEKLSGALPAAAAAAAPPAAGAACLAAAPATPATAGKLRLLAGPILFHNGTASTWSEYNRQVSPEGYVEISPEDASSVGVADGGTLKVSTSAGSVTGKARVSSRVQKGLLFAPVHFPEMPVAQLYSGASLLAEVKVEKG